MFWMWICKFTHDMSKWKGIFYLLNKISFSFILFFCVCVAVHHIIIWIVLSICQNYLCFYPKIYSPSDCFFTILTFGKHCKFFWTRSLRLMLCSSPLWGEKNNEQGRSTEYSGICRGHSEHLLRELAYSQIKVLLKL